MSEEADEEMTRLAGLAEVQQAENLAVRFFIEPQEDETATKNQGRPIYRDVEMVEIRIPGDPDLRRSPVMQADKDRFPKQYLAFKRNQSQEAVSGTPLAQWALLSRAQVEEAKYLGAHTVEQLASASDASIQRFGSGWISIRQKARDWLQSAKDSSMLSKLRSELEERDARIKTMEDMLRKQGEAIASLGANGVRAAPEPAPADDKLQALEAKLERLLAAQAVPPPVIPKRRGRPPKNPQPLKE